MTSDNPTTTPAPRYELLYDEQGAFIGLREHQTTHSPAGLAALAAQLRQAEASLKDATLMVVGYKSRAEEAEQDRDTISALLLSANKDMLALEAERDGLKLALQTVTAQLDAATVAKKAGQQREAALAVLVERLASVSSQSLINHQGRRRFQMNPIVRYLLDNGPFDMNSLARLPFDDDDRAHFAQLIGYSLSGWGELSYVSDAYYKRATLLEPDSPTTTPAPPDDSSVT